MLKHNDISIKNSFSLPSPIKNIVKCRSPLYIHLIHDLVTNDIIQALNAGDVQTAIEKIGCETNTETNIVKLVTDVFQTRIENINRQISYLENLIPTSLNDRLQNDRKIETLNGEKNTVNGKIENIKERIQRHKDTTCPICFDSFKNPSVTNCCNNVFCTECLIRSFNMNSMCPLCRNESQGFVLISETETVRQPTKIESLMKILNDKPDGKFLIFSAYEESFKHIANTLSDGNFTFAQLVGTIYRINKLIDKYKNGNIKMLMLNSTHYGTGLNLEMTTDLIFFHKMNPDMEQQVIGRAQRPGRDTTLNIHYLFQENEFKGINQNNT